MGEGETINNSLPNKETDPERTQNGRQPNVLNRLPKSYCLVALTERVAETET